MAFLILVEGESDALTLWLHGYPALGLPGASNVKVLAAEHVLGFDRIVVCSEPDLAGQRFPMVVSTRLRELGFAGRIETLFFGPTGYKDVSALYLADPPGFRDAFDALLKEAAKSVEAPPTVAGPYEITKDGRTIFRKAIKSGHSEVFVDTELANFNCRILEDVLKDDGVSQERMLTIRAQVDSKQPQALEVPSKQFAAMNWTAQIRGGAVVAAGTGTRDRLREAIERLSGNMLERTIYTHTGWREIAGEWVYLHAGGGISGDGLRGDIQAELPPSLQDFRLPVPPEGEELRECLQTSLSMLDVGDLSVTLPLFAAMWRAAIGEVDFSIFLVGETGSYKSSLAAIAQRHFGGGFDRERLPGNWASTVNFNENLAFRAKDALLVIDDFRPATHGMDKGLQQAAERLFRAQGNRAGRGRLTSDANERPTRAPRGMILATAEEFVWGSSLEARMIVLEVARGQLDLDKLIRLHEAGEAGVLASSMAAWVQWLAPRLTDVRKRLARRATELMRNFMGGHPRVALSLGELQATLEIWQEFAGMRLPAIEATFAKKAEEHANEAIENQDQAARFVELYSHALTSKKTHARRVDGGKPTNALGWTTTPTGGDMAQGAATLHVDEERKLWYLDIASAYKVVYDSSIDGVRPNVGVRMITKLLNKGGYLASTGYDHGFESIRTRVKVGGVYCYFLNISPQKFGLPDFDN